MDNDLKQYIQFTKVDEDKRIVEGVVSSESVDSQGEVITADAMKRAMSDYMNWANIREMHQPKAVGRTLKIWQEGDKTKIQGKVVDNEAWEKVKERVYNGFSIGGRKLKQIGNKVTDIMLSEISLVDRPANPDAVLLMIKRDISNESNDELLKRLYSLKKEVNEMAKKKEAKQEEVEVKEKEEKEKAEEAVENNKEEVDKEEKVEEKAVEDKKEDVQPPKEEKDVIEEAEKTFDIEKIAEKVSETVVKSLNETNTQEFEKLESFVKGELAALVERLEKLEEMPIPVKAVKNETFAKSSTEDEVSPEVQKVVAYKEELEAKLKKAETEVEKASLRAELARVEAKIAK